MDLIQVYIKYDLYETLELDLSATTNDVKKKYKKLAIKFHPDKYLNSDELTDEEKVTLQSHFNLVNIAYDILSNEETRVSYDKARKEYLEAGQIFDLKKQFNDFEFNYGDKSTAKQSFFMEKEKLDSDNEKIAEEIRENTKKNLNRTYELPKVDELMTTSTNKKEYMNKFNNLFDQYRTKANPHSEIIEYNASDGFSSLENAFNLMEVSDKDFVESGMSIEEKMKVYQKEYNSLKIPEPKSKELPKFNSDDKLEFEKKRLH
jgi:curved DNA-binding protein CbpA